MVLLHLLCEAASLHRWKIALAHFNHHLRGRASDADEAFVGRAASSRGLPFVAGRGDVRALARRRGVSTEMAGRQLRHAFLARTALDHGIRRVALAHHADDQTELFLLRLFRGAGSQGLSGMKWSGPSPANPEITLIRPLLAELRKAIEEYALRNRIQFREDTTNRSLDFLRNRIRHKLIPLLSRSFQPALHRTLPRLMDLLRAEAEYIDLQARQWLDVPSGPFEDLPVALQRRCLHIQLLSAGVVPDFDLVEQLRVAPGKRVLAPTSQSSDPGQDSLGDPAEDAETRSPSLTEFEPGASGQTCAWLRDSTGRVRPAPVLRGAFKGTSLRIDLATGSGKASFGGLTAQWDVLSRRVSPPKSHRAGREWFDADRVGQVLVLRHWQPGDRFCPIGMAQTVKLQDLFVNQKVPRAHRHELVIAATEHGEIVWVEGLRISERFKLSSGARRCLRWRWRRE